MKHLLILVFTVLSAFAAMSDTITLIDGSTIEGTVRSITTNELEYTTENSTVIRSILLKRVFSVKYNNGQIETFTTSTTPTNPSLSQPSTNVTAVNREELKQKEEAYQKKFGKGNIRVMLGLGIAWQNIPPEKGYKGSEFMGPAVDFRAMYLHTDKQYKGDWGGGLGILYETGDIFDNNGIELTYLTIPLSLTMRSHRWFYGMDLMPGFKLSAKIDVNDIEYNMGKCANNFYISYGLHGGVQFGKFDLGLNLSYRFTKMVRNGETKANDDGRYIELSGIKGGSGFEGKFIVAYRFKIF